MMTYPKERKQDKREERSSLEALEGELINSIETLLVCSLSLLYKKNLRSILKWMHRQFESQIQLSILYTFTLFLILIL